MERAGNYEEALTEYRLALKLKPDYAEARYHLGLVYSFLGRHAEAAAELEKVLDQEGIDAATVRHYLGYSYVRLDREDEAIVHLRDALARKETVQSHWVLGQAYEKQGDYRAAESQYLAVARLESDNQEVKARLEALQSRASTLVVQPTAPAP